MASAKGHEYFLKHYLGTHNNAIAEDLAEGSVKEVVWHEHAPQGKMDLVVDLNFRMDTSALYSDIVLPAATWYEKADLNSTDMHSFIHPLSAAVPPCWESKSDWQIFRAIAKKFSELAREALPRAGARTSWPRRWRTTPPPRSRSRRCGTGSTGEVRGDPRQDHAGLAGGRRATTATSTTSSSRSARWRARTAWARTARTTRSRTSTTRRCATLPTRGRGTASATRRSCDDEQVCDIDPALRHGDQRRAGLPLVQEHGGEGRAAAGASGGEEPRRARQLQGPAGAARSGFINSPMWSGLIENGRAYSPFTYNVEALVPWRTLTGRQHFYLDHPGLHRSSASTCRPTSRSRCPTQYADLRFSERSRHDA